MFRLKLITFFSLFIFFNVHSQSYIDLLKGKTYETIECESINVEEFIVVYIPLNTKKPLEVNLSRLKGYYSEVTNTYYYQKTGFKQRIVEGNINIYSAVALQKQTIYNYGGVNNHGFNNSGLNNGHVRSDVNVEYLEWYLEQGSQIDHFYNQKKATKTKDKNNNKKKLFKKELFETKISKDSISLKELSLLGETPKIKDLIKIIKGYNKRNFLKNKKQIALDFSEVIIFRDNKKQAKKPLEFTLNGKEYVLERNSKLKLSIPNNKSSLICITNDINNSCDLISSSSNFPKYFELKLNKDNESDISKANGNSSYLKTRLDYYEKNSKKSE